MLEGKGGLEGEIGRNLVDVVCTWIMLSGMALSAFWIDWAVPRFCDSNANDKVIHCDKGFPCVLCRCSGLPPQVPLFHHGIIACTDGGSNRSDSRF